VRGVTLRAKIPQCGRLERELFSSFDFGAHGNAGK
jgi:hypothetical protein